MEYTAKDIDPLFYPANFAIAQSLYLAALMAPRLTGGDPHKLGDKAMTKFLVQLSVAQAEAANEEQPEEAPDSEFIRARDGGDFYSETN